MTLTVVDYDSGNVGSVMNMLKRLNIPSTRSSDPQEIAGAERLILPGVGAFDAAMTKLISLDIDTALREAVTVRRTPILGICLGMQLLTRGSEEGDFPGFGWLAAEARLFRFDQTNRHRVPHMGWNVVRRNSSHLLFGPEDLEKRFYFAHSYHVDCDNESDVIGLTTYGYDFVSVVGRNHVLGAQFHPERSHRFGMEFLERFALLDKGCFEPA